MKLGADVEYAPKERCPPLFVAIMAGDKDAIAVLLEAGADPNRTVVGKTPLMIAVEAAKDAYVVHIKSILLRVERGCLFVLLIVLSKSLGSLFNCELFVLFYSDYFRSPPKALAALLRQLVAGGARLEEESENAGTVLHFAASQNSVTAVEALLALGAQPNARGPDGITPLETALRYHHADAALALLAYVNFGG